MILFSKGQIHKLACTKKLEHEHLAGFDVNPVNLCLSSTTCTKISPLVVYVQATSSFYLLVLKGVSFKRKFRN